MEATFTKYELMIDPNVVNVFVKLVDNCKCLKSYGSEGDFVKSYDLYCTRVGSDRFFFDLFQAILVSVEDTVILIM